MLSTYLLNSCGVQDSKIDAQEKECIGCNSDVSTFNNLFPQHEIVSIDQDLEETNPNLNLLEAEFLNNYLNKENKFSKSISKVNWEDTKYMEFESGLNVYITSINMTSTNKELPKYKNQNELLISYVRDGTVRQLLFQGYSNLTPEQLKDDASLAKDLETNLTYSALDGRILVDLETKGEKIISNSSKMMAMTLGSSECANPEWDECCAAESWDLCVKDNLSESGGAELLACMALGPWCAGGLAAMCTLDVAAEIERPIYCD